MAIIIIIIIIIIIMIIIIIRPINIKSDIFQGDSLSPLLFCMALAPLSPLLQDSGCGYEIRGQKINHLFFMEYLKTYAKDDN